MKKDLARTMVMKNHMNEKIQTFLSVIMPVHNGEKYLREAIESVLSQTYPHFELIIINDGSKDTSEQIINEYLERDHRVRAFNIAPNAGVSNARNLGIDMAKGELIVNMDCDDVNHPARFSRQISYLKLCNKNIDVLGTWFRTFYDDASAGYKSVPVSVSDLYDGKPPVHNPTCIIKRATFAKHGKYRSKYDNAEDYELWSRWSSRGVVFDNLPEDLYEKRIHQECASISRIKRQVYLMFKINIVALILYRRKFTRAGYFRIFEQLAYFIYLGLCLDRLFRGSTVLERIKTINN